MMRCLQVLGRPLRAHFLQTKKKHFSLQQSSGTAIQQPQDYPQEMEAGAQKPDAVSVQHEEEKTSADMNLLLLEKFHKWQV